METETQQQKELIAQKEESKRIWNTQYEIKTWGETINITPLDVFNIVATGTIKPSINEVMLFINVCRGAGLNPFLKDAYLTKYSASEPATIVVGKNAFMKKAESNQKYRGFEAGIIVDKVGTIEHKQGSFILPDEKLLGGWARVHRDDRAVPFFAEVALSEYINMKKDGTPNKFWGTKTATMIRKVALVQCLREAFPAELAGLYEEDEIKREPIDTEHEEVFDISDKLQKLETLTDKDSVKIFSLEVIKDFNGKVPQELSKKIFEKMRGFNA